MGKLTSGGLPLKSEPEAHECPYCRRPIGYVGRFASWLVGTRFHGCDFSNVDFERSRAALKEAVNG